MDLNSLIWFLLVGLVAGWLAGQIMKGRGFGLVGNIIVGIVGAVVGGFLFDALGISLLSGTAGYILTAVIGAIALLFIVGLVKKTA
jgi:uncharacterized membrane protein YeaQ/YmgE (transglycosylase-associated protein family)